MEKKRIPIILLAALLIIGLAACTRPASRAPSELATPTPAGGGFPLPGTSDVMGQLEVFATQTAIALQGGAPPATQAPVLETPSEGTPAGGETTGGETPAAQTTPPAESVPPTEAPAVDTAAAPVQEATTPPQPAAPTNTMVPIPTATPGIPARYTLKGGEFPFCIARRFNVDPGELLNLNGLGANSPTSPGTVLQIPQSGNPFPGQRALKDHPTTYTVQAGDTVNSIACQYGDVDPDNIILANGLSGSGNINAGQTLQIP